MNYPIKAALVILDNNGIIDMENELHKFSVSCITMGVAKYGLSLVVNSWNSHCIPGKLAFLALYLSRIIVDVSREPNFVLF